MVSEHIVLGTDADAGGLPANPRDCALPGNQDPRTPWPSSLLLLSAVASVTTRVRLNASAVIPPLRHPLEIANELATLDPGAQTLPTGGTSVVVRRRAPARRDGGGGTRPGIPGDGGRHAGPVPRGSRRGRPREALAAIPEQVARGLGTCIKPSQFTDDRASVPALLTRIVERVAEVTGT
jgi:hypothetical protein